MTERTPVVVALDEQSDCAIDLGRWGALATAALLGSGIDTGELNLLFVDEAAMTELNREHMDEDRPTDVLSFPLDGLALVDGSGGTDSGMVGDVLLGDVVVCPGYAARQAADHRGDRGHDGSLDDELALLIVHGILHVLGHDHAEADETLRMRACEDELLAAHHRP